MIDFLKKLVKLLPIFFTALILAVIVWLSSVSSSDPNQVVTYSNPIPLVILGQNPDLLITDKSASDITVTLRAPRSIHEQISRNFNLVSAQINLSGLMAGTYELTPEVNVRNFKPVQVVEINPAEITISLEQIAQRSHEITLLQTGSLPVSYEASEPVLSSESVQLQGPESKVNEVIDVVAVIDLTNATTTITRIVELRPIDRRGNEVQGVSLNPASITIEVPIRQLVGYRNVFIKIVTTGSIVQGYHLTSLVVNPPSVTIYATDPALVPSMPSFLETEPINLTGAVADFSTNVSLQLQDGIVVVGNQEVTVEIGIDAIETSIQLLDVRVEILNLGTNLRVNISPEIVDLYISGPMNVLETLSAKDIRVTLDLRNRIPGTYQITPDVLLNNSELKLDSILPGTIQVIIWR
ncbi:MAG: hypothetical protein GX773_00310 [Chloroflexi bacterium]|nr:hypothetical protein [Chloroflexota bacterium]